MDDQRTSGWVFFAAVLLIVAGVMRIFDAIWAFRYDGALPENLEDALFGKSLSSYGWVWLVVAAVLILAGLSLFSGSQFGRWIGIGAAVIAGLSAMTWMPYYPIWSLTYVALAVLVIYGLAVHAGRRTVT